MAKDSGNPETKSMGERAVYALHVWEVHRRCSLLLRGVGAHIYIELLRCVPFALSRGSLIFGCILVCMHCYVLEFTFPNDLI